MKVLQNPETQRWIVFFIFILAVTAMATAWLVDYLVRSSEMLHRERVTAVLGYLAEQDPQLAGEAVAVLDDPMPENLVRGQVLLERLGRTEGAGLLSAAVVRDLHSRGAVAMGIWAGVFSSLWGGALLVKLVRRERWLHELREFAVESSHGRFHMDIREDGEGAYHALKKEIYTMSTALHRQREEARLEKEHLATSLADISHQLKTPLTSLLMMTELLQQDPDDETRRSFLDNSSRQLQRMSWLTDGLLKLSRLDAGTVVLERIPVSMHSLLDQAVEVLEPHIQEKQIRLAGSGDGSQRVHADPSWTGEALINILRNALQHAPVGSTIHVSYDGNFPLRLCCSHCHDRCYQHHQYGAYQSHAPAAGVGRAAFSRPYHRRVCPDDSL